MTAAKTNAAPLPAATALRPVTALPSQIQRQPAAPTTAAAPVAQRPPGPPKRPAAGPGAVSVAPSTPGAVVAQKTRGTEVTVDQSLVDELALEDLPHQGKSIQVEGELRNAPFTAGSPSRYRLQARDAEGTLEMVCHVHGHAAELRPYVGKGVSIRGREYWVEESDMPVVVVGQIVPLASTSEPVMF